MNSEREDRLAFVARCVASIVFFGSLALSALVTLLASVLTDRSLGVLGYIHPGSYILPVVDFIVAAPMTGLSIWRLLDRNSAINPLGRKWPQFGRDRPPRFGRWDRVGNVSAVILVIGVFGGADILMIPSFRRMVATPQLAAINAGYLDCMLLGFLITALGVWRLIDMKSMINPAFRIVAEQSRYYALRTGATGMERQLDPGRHGFRWRKREESALAVSLSVLESRERYKMAFAQVVYLGLVVMVPGLYAGIEFLHGAARIVTIAISCVLGSWITLAGARGYRKSRQAASLLDIIADHDVLRHGGIWSDTAPMTIVSDPEADAAFVHISGGIPAGSVPRFRICYQAEVKGTVILVFSPDDHLVGLEILGASHVLPPELLAMGVVG